jgi:hypothetical protein
MKWITYLHNILIYTQTFATMKLDIESLLSGASSINCIEIYFLQHPHTSDHAINVSNSMKNLEKGFGSGFQSTYTTFYYKDLSYVYDMANDGQRVLKREFIKDLHEPQSNVYALCLNEDTLPSQAFPCVDTINHKNTLHRQSYRINNRLFLCHDTITETTTPSSQSLQSQQPYECIYLRYNHASQVDLKKIQGDIDQVIRRLTRKAPGQ